MNYSPGPWRVGSDGVTVILSDGQEISLASEAKDRAAANARLVAAAPELLAALREAVRLYETYGLVAGDGNCGKWVNDSRDAIHKAESL